MREITLKSSQFDLFDLAEEGSLPKESKWYYKVKGDDIEVSDGYHTMEELYDHRRALTAALCNYTYIVDSSIRGVDAVPLTWKSKLHSDGTMFDGYFVVGLITPSGQISYHYSLEYWEQFRIPELPKAPTYDGHTSQDVIQRLLEI